MSKRMVGGLMEGLNQALEYAEGKNSNVRITHMEVKPVPKIPACEIRVIRMNCNYTQELFAQALGVSKKAVEAWECGRNRPTGAAIRMLRLAKEDPAFFEKAGIVSIRKDAQPDR